MAEISKLVRVALENSNLDIESSTWDCHGTLVILHKACQIIAQKAGINFGLPYLVESDPEKGTVVVLVTGTMEQDGVTREEWSFGEASSGNNKNKYPYAMAEKRAKDRVTLALAGIHGYVYSEIEAEDFADAKPGPVTTSNAPEMNPETETASGIDHIHELNAKLIALGCESSDDANRVCAWAWDNPTLGVEQARETQLTARDTLVRMDDLEAAGVGQEDMLETAADYVQQHLV